MSLVNSKKRIVEPYDMEIHLKIWMPNYQKLKTMVKRSMDQKLRLRNFDARNERIENRGSGYESQGSKLSSKRTRSVLPMESNKAVFERRQVKFPAR